MLQTLAWSLPCFNIVQEIKLGLKNFSVFVLLNFCNISFHYLHEPQCNHVLQRKYASDRPLVYICCFRTLTSIAQRGKLRQTRQLRTQHPRNIQCNSEKRMQISNIIILALEITISSRKKSSYHRIHQIQQEAMGSAEE